METGSSRSFATCAIFLGLFLLSASLVAIQLSKRCGHNCDLIGVIPSRDPARHKNVPDEALDAMVNFAGYLVYESQHLPPEQKNKNAILPLDLNYLKRGRQWLQLIANCARFNFSLSYNSQANTYSSMFINFEVRKEPEVPGFEHLCHIEPHNIVFNSDYRFVCQRTVRYPCIRMRQDSRGQDYPETIAWFVADNLEIELDGSSDAYRKGNFSKCEQLCN